MYSNILQLIEKEFPNIQVTESGVQVFKNIMKVLTSNYDTNPQLVEAIFEAFLNKLKYLNGYGGVVNDGEYHRLSTFSKNDDIEYINAVIDAHNRQHLAPKDLRPRYKVSLYGDGKYAFGISWHQFNSATNTYEYSFNGGLFCHSITGQEFPPVQIGDYNHWSINT